MRKIILILLIFILTISCASANKAFVGNNGELFITDNGGKVLSHGLIAGATGDYYFKDNVIIVGLKNKCYAYDISTGRPNRIYVLDAGMQHHMSAYRSLIIASGERVVRYNIKNIKKPVEVYDCLVTGKVYDIDKFSNSVYVIKTSYGYFYGTWVNNKRPAYSANKW